MATTEQEQGPPPTTPGRFAGRSVLVTGASSGLGAACARRFAREGADVWIAARSADRLAEVAESCAGLPGQVRHGRLDVADPGSCAEAVAEVVAAYGRLDVLVNNAGRHDFRRTVEVTDEEWQRDLATNLSGAFFLSRAAIPHLLEHGGNIVNVASVAALEGQVYSAGYAAAKHGLVGLTKALAVEYLRTGLRVNCVCPGGMDTEQARNIAIPEDPDWNLVGRIAATRGFMPPEDVASVVAFLASEEAASVHGSVQVVDHGHLAG